jgi:hypothetical protein
VKTEDELAGVLAHEIGHLSTHQSAIEVTRIFRVRLHITQVTDRADIFAKLHLMMRTPAKSDEEDGREDKNEMVADHVALYAMIQAGYAAESFPSFFNQVSLNKGKTGNWLSDMFGQTNVDSQRYRAAVKLIDTLPAGCKERQAGESDAFKAWHKRIVEERVQNAAERGGERQRRPAVETRPSAATGFVGGPLQPQRPLHSGAGRDQHRNRGQGCGEGSVQDRCAGCAGGAVHAGL